MKDLQQMVGKETSLDQFHLTLRRVAGQIPKVSAFGFCLVSCSDEREGPTRSGFDRDVATPLVSDGIGSNDQVFSLTNLGSRLEPGAFSLVDDHFTRKTIRGPKLLVVEIASHVGRIRHDSGHIYGRLERFGRESVCCGALTSLLDTLDFSGTVDHPWLEQLYTSFGPVRLAALGEFDDSTRMVAAAIVHAVLQAESAVSQVLQNPPGTPTEVLLVAGVSVNQQWAGGFLPVAYHHLQADTGVTEIVSGYSLRTTPEALKIDLSGDRIEVEAGRAMEAAPQVQRRPAGAEAEPAAAETLAALAALAADHQEELEKRLDQVRAQVESIRHDPAAWRSYARPILRGLFRGLSVVQAEHGPSSTARRRVQHEIESELQQLNHEDAQQVLDRLLSKK